MLLAAPDVECRRQKAINAPRERRRHVFRFLSAGFFGSCIARLPLDARLLRGCRFMAERTPVGPLSVFVDHAVLPPLDLAGVVASQLGAVTQPVIPFDPVPDPLSNATSLRGFTGHDIEPFSRIDDKEKIVSQVSAAPLHVSWITHVHEQLHVVVAHGPERRMWIGRDVLRPGHWIQLVPALQDSPPDVVVAGNVIRRSRLLGEGDDQGASRADLSVPATRQFDVCGKIFRGLREASRQLVLDKGEQQQSAPERILRKNARKFGWRRQALRQLLEASSLPASTFKSALDLALLDKTHEVHL